MLEHKFMLKVIQWAALILWGKDFSQWNQLQVASSSDVYHNLLIIKIHGIKSGSLLLILKGFHHASAIQVFDI